MSGLVDRGCRFAVMVVLGLVASTQADAKDPVHVEAVITPSKLGQNRFTVTVTFDIEAGWHTYDGVPDGAASPATGVSLEPPVGVKAVGEWKRPAGLPYLEAPNTTIYEGTVEFTRDIEVQQEVTSGKVEIVVQFQACTDKVCQPPRKLTLAVKIPAVKTDEGVCFADPVRLTVDGKPLNQTVKQMYPSPAMYDVDDDGQTELVVGDIFGSLYIYENQNESRKGDPVWSKDRSLNSRDGKPIKVSNW